jgi:2-methylcitrate dehydratase PrpD
MASSAKSVISAEGLAGEQTLTQGLVELIRSRPVSRNDLDVMALFVLDGLANMLAGRNTEPGRILLAWSRGRQGDAGRRALLMGGLMHVLEVDDLHRASVTHPGCTVIPAALALAQSTGADAGTFLRAVLHGFEAITRVGMAVGQQHYKIWHNTATCGPYGAAMAAAAVLGLDDRQTVHALGNAGTQSAGLWEFLSTGAMSKHLHAGRAAEAGVVSAELAAEGFTGPPAILEGPQGFFAGACPDPDPGAVLRAPDAPWQVHLNSIKPWPSCRHTHPSIDAALELSGKIDPAAIAAIDISTYQAAVDLCDRAAPDNLYEAKFSLQHCVASALATGEVRFGSFEVEPRVALAPLRDISTARAGEPYRGAYPKSWGSEITVTLKDGSKIAAARKDCKGDPELPVTRDELIAKARDLLSFGGVGDPDAMIETVLAMADGGELFNHDLSA